MAAHHFAVPVLLASAALSIASHCPGAEAPGAVRVIYAPREIPEAERLRLLGRMAEPNPSTPIPDRHATMRQVLGGPVARVEIHHYPKTWGSFRVVSDYVNRLMDAPPEAGLMPMPIWAEGVFAEVFGTIEFVKGTRRPLQMAKGYLFFQDIEGRNWFARYLGGDKDRWVVPKTPPAK